MLYQNTEQLKELYLQLLKDEYVEAMDGKMVFTLKFMQLMTGVQPVTALTTLPPNSVELLNKLQRDWTMGFMNFIVEAKVPRQQQTSKGDVYIVNNYSEPAKKVFQKAIEKEGVVYEVLVKSTMLYYKSNNQYKKTIGNYFTQGDWRSDYMALVESLKDGTLEQHIKTEINESGKSQYQLG